jgi:hypothetical protein
MASSTLIHHTRIPADGWGGFIQDLGVSKTVTTREHAKSLQVRGVFVYRPRSTLTAPPLHEWLNRSIFGIRSPRVTRANIGPGLAHHAVWHPPEPFIQPNSAQDDWKAIKHQHHGF